MHKYLVRAYFEIHGDFEGIVSHDIYPFIVSKAKEANINITEYLYRCLGYSFDNSYSAQERSNIRKLACKFPNPELNDLFSASTEADIKSTLKSFNLLPKFFVKQLPQVEHRDVIVMLARFIETTEHLILTNNDKVSKYIGELFFSLKLPSMTTGYRESFDHLCKLIETLLTQAVIKEKSSKCYIVGKTIVLNFEPDIPRLARQVSEQIAVRHYTIFSTHYSFVVNNLPIYQSGKGSDENTYLSMLDIANCYNCTLKGLIESLGFNYIDQLNIFTHTGYLIYQGRDNFFLLDPVKNTTANVLGYAGLKDYYDDDKFKRVVW